MTWSSNDNDESSMTPRIFVRSDTAIGQPATEMYDGRPGFRRPGFVPKNAASDLSGLRSRSLLQNQCSSAAVQLDSLSKLDAGVDRRVIYIQ